MADVFISYANKDKKYTDKLSAQLEQSGLTCWMAPRDIKPGEEYAEGIMRGIDTSDCMVIIFSEASNKSKHVLREVERAVTNETVIIPFRISDIEPSGSMDYFLKISHWLDAMNMEDDEAFAQLRETIVRIVGEPEKPVEEKKTFEVPEVKPSPEPKLKSIDDPRLKPLRNMAEKALLDDGHIDSIRSKLVTMARVKGISDIDPFLEELKEDLGDKYIAVVALHQMIKEAWDKDGDISDEERDNLYAAGEMGELDKKWIDKKIKQLAPIVEEEPEPEPNIEPEEVSKPQTIKTSRNFKPLWGFVKKALATLILCGLSMFVIYLIFEAVDNKTIGSNSRYFAQSAPFLTFGILWWTKWSWEIFKNKPKNRRVIALLLPFIPFLMWVIIDDYGSYQKQAQIQKQIGEFYTKNKNKTWDDETIKALLPISGYLKKWDKTFGSEGYENANSIILLSTVGADGLSRVTGFVVAGGKSDGKGKNAWWIIRLDVEGNKLWEKTYAESNSNQANSIVAINTVDAKGVSRVTGFAVAGIKKPINEDDDYDAWVICFDANGNKLWDKTFGESNEREGAESIMPLKTISSNGVSRVTGFAVAGWKQSQGAWVVRLDADGNKLWDKTYGDRYVQRANSIIPLNSIGGDGISRVTGFVVAGEKHVNSVDPWVFRLDANGNKMWDKTFYGRANDTAKSIIPITTIRANGTSHVNGFAVAGYVSLEYRDLQDAWVVRLDGSGNTIWEKTYGGNSSDFANSIIPLSTTSENGDSHVTGFAVAGRTFSKGGRGSNAWVFELDANGKMIWDKTIGGKDNDQANSLIPIRTIGNHGESRLTGFAVAGATRSKGAGGWDAWVIRLDKPTKENVLAELKKK